MGLDPATGPRPRTSTAARWIGLSALAVVLVGALAVLAWWLDRQGFVAKLAESLLQLGIIVILAAVAKYIVDDRARQRDAARDDHEERQRQQRLDDDKRRDFLRRLSSAHVRIAHSRLLMVAHRSAKTYTEQVRHLMLVRPELDEIVEDLRATGNLFGEDTGKIAGHVKWISNYLSQATDEYVRFHELVSDRARRGKSFDSTVDEAVLDGHRMDWVSRFTAGADFPTEYNDALIGSKIVMRARVFGPQ